MAGEMLGLKLIFMDGGSGATNPISESMINLVSKGINIPPIIGGGINSVKSFSQLQSRCRHNSSYN